MQWVCLGLFFSISGLDSSEPSWDWDAAKAWCAGPFHVAKPWQVTFHVYSAVCAAMPSMSMRHVCSVSAHVEIISIYQVHLDFFKGWYGNIPHYHGVLEAHFFIFPLVKPRWSPPDLLLLATHLAGRMPPAEGVRTSAGPPGWESQEAKLGQHSTNMANTKAKQLTLN